MRLMKLQRRKTVSMHVAWFRQWPGYPYVVWSLVGHEVKRRRIRMLDLVRVGDVLRQVLREKGEDYGRRDR